MYTVDTHTHIHTQTHKDIYICVWGFLFFRSPSKIRYGVSFSVISSKHRWHQRLRFVHGYLVVYVVPTHTHTHSHTDTHTRNDTARNVDTSISKIFFIRLLINEYQRRVFKGEIRNKTLPLTVWHCPYELLINGNNRSRYHSHVLIIHGLSCQETYVLFL